jgi:hypothetical protein
MADTVKRTIRRPFFSYDVPLLDESNEQIIGLDGRPRFFQKLGYMGDTVDLYPADAERGDKHGVFLQEGESLEDPLSQQIRLSDLGLLTDDQLLLLWEDKPPKVDDLLEAVGENSDLAVKVLAAENASAKPRKALVGQLQEIANGVGE